MKSNERRREKEEERKSGLTMVTTKEDTRIWKLFNHTFCYEGSFSILKKLVHTWLESYSYSFLALLVEGAMNRLVTECILYHKCASNKYMLY